MGGPVVRNDEDLPVDFVPIDIPGRLGLCVHPGRNKPGSSPWKRDFCADIATLAAQHHTTAVVTLVDPSETHAMGIKTHEYTHRLADLGIEHITHPVRDKWIPSERSSYADVVRRVIAILDAGGTVVAHCNGGKGRAGTLATAVLAAVAWRSGDELPVMDAVRMVRAAREGTIRNPIQIAWLRFRFIPWWRSRNARGSARPIVP